MMFTGFCIGAFLGFANVLLVAVGIAHADPSITARLVVTVGLVPGVGTGALLGLIAGARASARPQWRFVLLAIPACAVVAMLGAMFRLEHYILVACIPTLAGCGVLERATREPPAIPCAHVQ